MQRVLLIGDAPNEPSGLGRIARDIASIIHTMPDTTLYQAGLRYDGGIWPWHVFPIHDEANWGEADLPRILEQLNWPARQDLRIITVWDPARCYTIATQVAKLKQAFPKHNVELWGYFAIDSCNEYGSITGPAAVAVQQYDRVLAYSKYGKRVLETVYNKHVRWIPHSVGSEFRIKELQADQVLQLGLDPMQATVGVVATNQPRKDLGLVFRAMQVLNDRYMKVAGLEPVQLWIHTDHLYRHWAITELAELYGFNNELLSVSTYLEQEALIDMYNVCAATIAPGLGEGFGYPIVESLACGVPVVHGKFAAGPEWMPMKDWMPLPRAMRYEGLYVLQRPVFDPVDVANILYLMLRHPPNREWLRLQVRHLQPDMLLPRWRQWLAGKPEDDVIKEEK